MHRLTINRYGYRQAEVYDRITSISFDSGDGIYDFWRELVELTSKQAENHECYEVIHEDGSVIYFQFSDWKCYIGFSIRVENW